MNCVIIKAWYILLTCFVITIFIIRDAVRKSIWKLKTYCLKDFTSFGSFKTPKTLRDIFILIIYVLSCIFYTYIAYLKLGSWNEFISESLVVHQSFLFSKWSYWFFTVFITLFFLIYTLQSTFFRTFYCNLITFLTSTT